MKRLAIWGLCVAAGLWGSAVSSGGFESLAVDGRAGLERAASFRAEFSASPAPQSLKQRIDRLVEGRYAHVRPIYEDFHRFPELSKEEKRTSSRMAAELVALNFAVTERVGGYGVVSVLKNGEGPTVLVRADMDALPIQEETKLPYQSQVPGVMHACGHDVHMSVQLGAAYVLSQLQDSWQGTLVMVSQPAEESGIGAMEMIRDGLFVRFPKPDFALAMHVSSLLAGQLGYRPGYAYSAMDNFNITLVGRGGHGARPDLTIDPFMMMAELIHKLQAIRGREIDPQQPAVISLGRVQGGNKHNIIPDSVRLEGTIRSYDDKVRDYLKERVKEAVEGVAAINRAPSPQIEFIQGTPSVYNDPALALRLAPVFQEALGPSHVSEVPPVMQSEDFTYYGREGNMPALIFWIGAQPHLNAPVPPAHSSRFAPDFKPTWSAGVKAMSAAVISLMPRTARGS